MSRNFLLKSQGKYDSIELKLPTLHTDGVVFQYTQEFDDIARSRLKPGGVQSQWIDANQTDAASLSRTRKAQTSEAPEVRSGPHKPVRRK